METEQQMDELDLDNPADVIKFILSFFKQSLQADAESAVVFYVAELRKKVNKTNPLSHWVQKEIIKSGVLNKPQARQSWLKCWHSNRSLRYVRAKK